MVDRSALGGQTREPPSRLSAIFGPLLVPTLVVTEVTCLLRTRCGVEAEVRFLGDLASGAFTSSPVAVRDWLRITKLVAHYRGLRLGTVEASVVAAVQRLDIPEIATLDRRHFGVVRPRHVDAFRLLPDGVSRPLRC